MPEKGKLSYFDGHTCTKKSRELKDFGDMQRRGDTALKNMGNFKEGEGRRVLLRCVYKNKNGQWVGTCLELCLVSVGETVDEAIMTMRDMVQSHLKARIQLRGAGETPVLVSVPGYWWKARAFDAFYTCFPRLRYDEQHSRHLESSSSLNRIPVYMPAT